MVTNKKDFFKDKKIWSITKDKLLGGYLVPYFQKLLTSSKPILYVDCFAGKGKFDDGEDGSPIIALKCAEDAIRKSKTKDKHIKMIFIENEWASQLQTLINDYDSKLVDVSVVDDDFNSVINDILKMHKGWNVFLYLDPYGYKCLRMDLFREIAKMDLKTIEMLINFNSFGFFRNACLAKKININDDDVLNDTRFFDEFERIPEVNCKEKQLNSVAGGDYWKNTVDKYSNNELDGYWSEVEFSNNYKSQLLKIFNYVNNMPIRLKSGDRPKYRMVHITNNESGCFIMGDNMLRFFKEHVFIVYNKKQTDIYDYIQDTDSLYDFDESQVNKEDIANKVKELLYDYGSYMHITQLIAKFNSKYGLLCKYKIIYEVLRVLENDSIIIIRRIPSKTKYNKPSSFMTESSINKQVLIKINEGENEE